MRSLLHFTRKAFGISSPTLKILERPSCLNVYDGLVELTLLDGRGQVLRFVRTQVTSRLHPHEQESMRWYLEDYLQFPQDPAPSYARQIEQRMAEVGEQIFLELFERREAWEIWYMVRDRIEDTRIEILSRLPHPLQAPWELMRDPIKNIRLALQSRAFVHTLDRQGDIPAARLIDTDRVRILIVICRPGGAEDIPFRSVANSLLNGLGDELRRRCQIDVLRPPTFDRLSEVLGAARAEGRPYHIVHFDGHGIFDDLTARMLGREPRNKRGYVLFEGPNGGDEYVDGLSMGRLLVEADVPLLVLNACRSGKAEQGPGHAVQERTPFGSLAEEIMSAGVSGVAAMRYSIYAVAAAQFVTDLYTAIASGRPLAEAVTLARRGMAQQRTREVFYTRIPVEDWLVPVVYEAESAPSLLIRRPAKSRGNAAARAAEAGEETRLDPALPPPPSVGFIGADEILLTLDRAFTSHPVVLVYGFSGGGKSATAAEFSRWYARTGGVSGRVLYSSFEQHTTLSDLFDKLNGTPDIDESSGGKSSKTKRRALIQRMTEILREAPVFWIWDNVEGVAGFPAGADSSWTKEERLELADFLREASEKTGAKFLLTSRRAETEWLGDLPYRTYIPYLSIDDRIRITQALAHKFQTARGGAEATGEASATARSILNWYPLLRFTKGNPLTISVIIRHGLAEEYETVEDIKAFLQRLRDGENCFKDATGGREVSLRASLQYGFEGTFDERELRQLGVLYFFQSIINVHVITKMADMSRPYYLPQLEGLTRESAITLLDRCVEIGLLRNSPNQGYYVNHPMAPWFFRTTFERFYPGRSGAYAFVYAMAERGAEMSSALLLNKIPQMVFEVQNEESNLLHARRIALRERWLHAVPQMMDSLRELYEEGGRKAAWRQLVEEVTPYFIDPKSDLPLPGLEIRYHNITDYRALVARQAGDYGEAERLQRIFLEWSSQYDDAHSWKDHDELQPDEREGSTSQAPWIDASKLQKAAYHARISALNNQAIALMELRDSRCVNLLKEALRLAEQSDDLLGQVATSFNLGRAYMMVPSITDLGEAEAWGQRALTLCPKDDLWRLGKCYKHLGFVALMRSEEQPEDKRESYLLNECYPHLSKALSLLPEHCVDDLAETHDLLGMLFREISKTDESLEHFRKSLRYREASGNKSAAAITRISMAEVLALDGRLVEAREFAESAYHNFKGLGEAGEWGAERAAKLLGHLNDRLQ